MRNFRKSERGSVMLEFCLVLPIYLLIFGGTFLLFDLSMARLHLQEANRNIAWIQDDRHNGASCLINQELYRRSVAFFEARNALELKMTNLPMWSFGEEYGNYQKDIAEKKGTLNPGFWGNELSEFNGNGVELNVNQSWADKLGGMLQSRLENDFVKIYYGNMELEMSKVSATYIGAVGVSSVLFPIPGQDGMQTVPLYKSAYTLTRARDDRTEEKKEEEHSWGTYKRSKVNGEMLILRRVGENENREKARTVNELTPLTSNILFGSWPSNGKLGDISILLGVGL